MRYQLGAFLFLLAIVTTGNAQTFRGAINGSVTDPTGGIVPRAEVVVENIATGIEHTTLTTNDGQFVFSRPSHWALTKSSLP